MTKPIQQVAMKAVIVNEHGLVLILCESGKHDTNTNGGRYQLPGGRVEPGEIYSDALDREIREETSLKVEQLYPVLVGEWRPVIKGVTHQIIGVFIVCSSSSSGIILSEEHDSFLWIKPEEQKKYNILSPDWEAIERYANGSNNRGRRLK